MKSSNSFVIAVIKDSIGCFTCICNIIVFKLKVACQETFVYLKIICLVQFGICCIEC